VTIKNKKEPDSAKVVIRQHPESANDGMNKPAKQSEEPKQFTEAELEETKAWLRTLDKLAEEDATKEEAAQKEALQSAIRTCRERLTREAKAKGCTPLRKREIDAELEDLEWIEEQECGRELRKHPSARHPSAEELGFQTSEPSADQILERDKKEPDSDGKRGITISAIESRCAEITDMLASPSNLTAEEQKQLKAELGLFKLFDRSSLARTRKKTPAWSSGLAF
jgi:hypothetical protein